MRLYRVLAGAMVLAVSSAGALRAAPTITRDFGIMCSPGAVRTCASMQVMTTLNLSGGTNVTILVRNLQGSSWPDNTGGSVLSRIGLSAPNIVGASGLTVTGLSGTNVTGNPGAQWFLRNPPGLGGPLEMAAGISRFGPGGITGCNAPAGGFPTSYFQTCNGGWVALTFTTTNAWSANDAEVAFLSGSFAVNGGGAECGSVADPSGGRSLCDNVAPEPVTMILLGSGLASMGGFGLVRRRKGTDVISD